MKFILEKPAKENIYTLIRKIGYYPLSVNEAGASSSPFAAARIKDEKAEEINCVKPLDRSGYPRFHIYLKTDGENLILNLHLDQKKPIYKGAPAHAGEYDGEIVKKEAERVKEILSSSPRSLCELDI